jgi:DNA mismatch repair protein MSH6
VLLRANEKSSDFEANYGKRCRMTKDKHDASSQREDKFSAIRDVLRIVKAWPHPDDQAVSISMLHEAQKLAKVLAVEG